MEFNLESGKLFFENLVTKISITHFIFASLKNDSPGGDKKTTLIFTKCNSFSMGTEKICFLIVYGLIQYMIPYPEIVTLFFQRLKECKWGIGSGR
jgi:hypothetical protein